MNYLPRIAILAAVAAASSMFGGCFFYMGSTTIDPIGAKVQSTILMEDVEDFQMTQLPGGSYAVARVNPNNNGHIIEVFDDALAVKWQHEIPYDRTSPITPLWLSGGTQGVTMVYYRHDDDDSLSIHGLILEAASGKVRETRALTGFQSGGRHSQFSAAQLVFSPDSSRFAMYRYDYRQLENEGARKVRLDAELFDTKLDRIGSAFVEIPVNDEVEDIEDAGPYIHGLFISNEGHGYQVSYHDPATMRVTQLDFAQGTTRMLERTIPEASFDDEEKQLRGTKVWTGANQEVILAASKVEGSLLSGDDLTGVALVGMNFSRSSVDFVKAVEITEQMANTLIDEDELEWFRLRDIVRMPGGEIILPLEQVEIGSVKDRSTGNRRAVYLHQTMVMLGFDAKGESIWYAVQNRPEVLTMYSGYRSDAMRIAGDSLHYIYHDADADGLVVGTLSARNGAMTFPKPLIKTSMMALNRYTKWVGDNSAMMVLNLGDSYRLVRFSY